MSKMYKKIKKYYDTGLWSEERVRNMVIKGIITEEEYKDITGNEYQEYIYYSFALLQQKYQMAGQQQGPGYM